MPDNQNAAAEWRVIGESVPGATHLRSGTPNQDAILQVRESGRSLPLVVSVSDGHGSDKCFRSHRGSRYAVKQAAQLVGDFLEELRGQCDVLAAAENLKQRVPHELVRQWKEAVERDLKARPFTAEELTTLEQKDGARARKLVEENPHLAYGATSLTVAVAESFVLYLQLGDGEILTVSEAGEVSKALEEDERLFANETTSLCTADAGKNFRVGLRSLGSDVPALILITTDGYANSFSDEAGFLKVGSDLLEMLRAEGGFDSVNESLKGWLEEATQSGSGDDTTLGIICRMSALKKHVVEEAKPGEAAVKTAAQTDEAQAKAKSETAKAEVVSAGVSTEAAAPSIAAAKTSEPKQ